MIASQHIKVGQDWCLEPRSKLSEGGFLLTLSAFLCGVLVSQACQDCAFFGSSLLSHLG